MAGVSAASGHSACCVENADRGAKAGKRGSRNARVVCSITLAMFCKTKPSAALNMWLQQDGAPPYFGQVAEHLSWWCKNRPFATLDNL
jgi:hypothetical protein